LKALDLHPGDTVVEVGCGTGLNISLLQSEVGPEARIIGVDLTDSMLERARKRMGFAYVAVGEKSGSGC